MRFTLLGGLSTQELVYNFIRRAEPYLANKGEILTDFYGFIFDEASIVASNVCNDVGMNVFIYPASMTPHTIVKNINDLKIQIVMLTEESYLPILKTGVKHSWRYVGIKNDQVKPKNIRIKSRYFAVEGDTSWPSQSGNNIRARKDLLRLRLPEGRRKSLL